MNISTMFLLLRNSSDCCLFVFASLPHMSIGTGVIVAVALQQVDGSPDAKTGTESYDEGLQYGDCAVKKCHKCVPPCFLRPFGLKMRLSFLLFACAPAKNIKNSQGRFFIRPGYVNRQYSLPACF